MSVPIRAYAICSLLGLALPASADEVAQQSSTGTPVEEILEVIQEDPFADAVVVIAEVYSEELLAEFRALWEFMALDADDIVNLGVTSRKVVWLLLEQLRLDFVPVLHRLQGRPAAQG